MGLVAAQAMNFPFFSLCGKKEVVWGNCGLRRLFVC